MVVNFTIATSESYKDKTTGEKKESTEWHNIVLWRGLAEIAAKYLHKGDMIYLEGKLRTRSWEKEGVTRYTTEIVGDNMTMLSTKGSGGSMGGERAAAPAYSSATGGNDFKSAQDNPIDDLPF
jgi:single-strand DNA-binding protein